MSNYIKSTEAMLNIQWLFKNGDIICYQEPNEPLSTNETLSDIQLNWFKEHDTAIVCMMNNKIFQACGICETHDDYKRFANPDFREKIWFVVPVTAILDDHVAECEESFKEAFCEKETEKE